MKKLLFSLTEKDFEWLYVRGSGPGGQKKNKTCSAVHCTHRPSGAHAFCQEHRSQRANREAAFARVTKQNKFRMWLKMEMARKTGVLDEVERCVDVAMQPKNLKCEVKGANGKWVVWDGDTMDPESVD